MKKTAAPIIIFAVLMALLSGCNLFSKKQETPVVKETQITYFTSAEDTNKFCNGADMDSEGFRKSITKENKATIPMGDLNKNELILQTLIYASNHVDFSWTGTVTENYLKIIGDTAYIQPIEGWAGVSIFLCYWKPFVEVNLMQFPEIKKVEWTTDQLQYDQLK